MQFCLHSFLLSTPSKWWIKWNISIVFPYSTIKQGAQSSLFTCRDANFAGSKLASHPCLSQFISSCTWAEPYSYAPQSTIHWHTSTMILYVKLNMWMSVWSVGKINVNIIIHLQRFQPTTATLIFPSLSDSFKIIFTIHWLILGRMALLPFHIAHPAGLV